MKLLQNCIFSSNFNVIFEIIFTCTGSNIHERAINFVVKIGIIPSLVHEYCVYVK